MMLTRFVLLSSLFAFCLTFTHTSMACATLLNHTVRSLNDENMIHLCKVYQDKVILVVNTASKCGFTPQYEGLETLYHQYQAQGLVVLGFPSNDFANQEPGDEADIQAFCRLTYGVQFPMFEKIHVTADQAHPFFAGLAQASGEYPQWNFHKYLIGRDGQLVASFPSKVTPSDAHLVGQIEQLLAASE